MKLFIVRLKVCDVYLNKIDSQRKASVEICDIVPQLSVGRMDKRLKYALRLPDVGDLLGRDLRKNTK